MTIGLVLLGLAVLLIWRPRLLRDAEYMSERWQRDHIYRGGKS
jgi:hypothetical protein